MLFTAWKHVVERNQQRERNGILLPKLFLPTVRKNCSSDREKLLRSQNNLFKQWKVRRILTCSSDLINENN